MKANKHNSQLAKTPVQTATDIDQYKTNKKLLQPLHEGTSRTLIDAISGQLFIFATNNGMSKATVSQCLQHEKRTLPQPNLLPSSYKEAVSIIQPL